MWYSVLKPGEISSKEPARQPKAEAPAAAVKTPGLISDGDPRFLLPAPSTATGRHRLHSPLIVTLHTATEKKRRMSAVFLIASAHSQQRLSVTCQVFLFKGFLAKSDVSIKISLLCHF